MSTRFEAKHQLILDTATAVFLKNGYLGTAMDEIAREAAISKQTVYKHFSSKETLFLEIIHRLTTRADQELYAGLEDPRAVQDVRKFLEAYSHRELATLLRTEVVSLRRMVIGESERFPEVARSFFEKGPQAGIRKLAGIFKDFHRRGLLNIKDAKQAAEDFNWLILAAFMNRAMFLGDAGLPSKREIRRHSVHAVAVFLQNYAA